MTRRFEFVEGTSAKFWEISRDGSVVTVRFGRLGTNGQTQTKDLGAESVAMEHAGRLILEKRRKGYQEVAAQADARSPGRDQRHVPAPTTPLPGNGPLVMGTVRLPAGRRITHDKSLGEAATDQPVLWLTDSPMAHAGSLVVTLRREVHGSGLVPFLAEDADFDAARPWTAGEFLPSDPREIAVIEIERALNEGWNAGIPEEDDDEGREHATGMLAPFGLVFPGIASRTDDRPPVAQPLGFRRLFSRGVAQPVDPWTLIESRTGLRIGLVAADRPADVITVLGWQGAVNAHQDTAPLSAILRSWEERFGAEAVQIGFDTLTLVVERPPMSRDHALAVAAEHFAFCPDNVMQGTDRLDAYADLILRCPLWNFWWD